MVWICWIAHDGLVTCPECFYPFCRIGSSAYALFDLLFIFLQITASLALSIVTTIGSTVAAIDFIKDMVSFTERQDYILYENYNEENESMGRHFVSSYTF